MMSNEWFRHDYNAHDDIKQKRILKAVGLAGIGLYWYLVEIIYQNGGQMADDDIRLEAELVGGLDLLKSLQEFNLLSLDDGIWSCKRITDELKFKEENKQKKSEAGKKGMASRWNNNTTKTADNSVITKDNSVITDDNKPYQAITEDNTLPYLTNTNKDKEVDKSNDLSPKKRNFTKPTVDEVRAYCKERGNNIDAQAFIDFYESKGWMIGKNHMKDWRAAVRTWERMDEKPRSGGGSYGNGKTFRPKDITGRYDDLESEVIEV